MKITVRIPKKVSTNPYYRMHWADRSRLHQGFYEEVFVAVGGKNIKVEEYPISLDLTFYLKGKLFDWVNLSAMAKMIEDGLVHNGVIKDDSKKFVDWGRMKCDRSEEKYNYCIVQIKKLNQ